MGQIWPQVINLQLLVYDISNNLRRICLWILTWSLCLMTLDSHLISMNPLVKLWLTLESSLNADFLSFFLHMDDCTEYSWYACISPGMHEFFLLFNIFLICLETVWLGDSPSMRIKMLGPVLMPLLILWVISSKSFLVPWLYRMWKWGWRCSSVVEYLSCMCEALTSISRKRNTNTRAHTQRCNWTKLMALNCVPRNPIFF